MGVFKSILLECLEKTSAKGIPRIVKKQALPLRFLWLVGVFVLGGLAAANLITLFEQYLEFPVTTTMREEKVSTNVKEVPELVVCNMQPFSKTGFNYTDGIIHFNQYQQKVKEDLPLESNDSVIELWEQLNSHKGYYKYLGTGNATQVGHNLTNYLIDCRILYATSASTTITRKLPTSSIRLISIPEFFNCYKLPLIGTVSDDSARPVGVTFILYMDRPQPALDQHFDEDSDVLQLGGIRMTLKMPGDFPDLRYRSFDAWPGEATHVGLRISKRVRLKSPFGACVESGERSYVDLQNNTLWYSPEACMNSFIQERIALQCNCTEPELLVVPSPELLRLPFCQAYTEDLDQLISRSACLKKVLPDAWSVDIRKLCLPLCTENRYSITLTTAEWPKKSQTLSFYQQFVKGTERYSEEFEEYEKILQLLESGNASEAKRQFEFTDAVEENFAKITVILDSDYVQVLKDVPKMTVDVLLSQIGGALNLYTGISFVVFVEVLDMIFKLVSQGSKK